MQILQNCEEQTGPSGESSLAIAQRVLNDHRITTTAIGIGQSGDVDLRFLEQLAVAGDGRFYFTSDMFTLPQIFTQESALVQRYYINEEQFTPQIGETEPLLSGINAVPDLLGYVATTLKPLATLSLSSSKQDPVLASWRYGVGQSAAFTSDPTAGWGKMWLAWPEYERFWAQLSRWIARANTSPNFEPVFVPQNDSTILIVEAMDAQGRLISDAKFHAVFVDETGKSQSMELSQTTPGRYEQQKCQVKEVLSGKFFGKKMGT